MQETLNTTQPHTLSLDNRERLNLTGVTDVTGFDEENICVETRAGKLIVKGQSLHISKLSLETGEVSVDGRVNALQYLGDAVRKGIVSKLFR